MSHVLIVIGSARKGRVADAIVTYVQKDIATRPEMSAVIADLKAINLPFFDNENSPASPDYAPTDEHVLAWQKMVTDADSVVFITPEYNHAITAIQKNALDSLYAEWNEKPTAVVAYSWTGGSHAVAELSHILPHLKALFHPETAAKLTFMKDINPDGSPIDEASVNAQIKKAIDSVA